MEVRAWGGEQGRTCVSGADGGENVGERGAGRGMGRERLDSFSTVRMPCSPRAGPLPELELPQWWPVHV